MLEAESFAGFAEGIGEIAGSIAGHDPLDDDTEALVIVDGSLGMIWALLRRLLIDSHFRV